MDENSIELWASDGQGYVCQDINTMELFLQTVLHPSWGGGFAGAHVLLPDGQVLVPRLVGERIDYVFNESATTQCQADAYCY